MITMCDQKNNTTIYMSIVLIKKREKNVTVFFTVQREGREVFWRGEERGAFYFTFTY